jgi:hypothetical protein
MNKGKETYIPYIIALCLDSIRAYLSSYYISYSIESLKLQENTYWREVIEMPTCLVRELASATTRTITQLQSITYIQNTAISRPFYAIA